MRPHGWELLFRGALEDAGVGALPLPARRRISDATARRLQQFGVCAELHNWGGVSCGHAAHEGCCEEVGGRRLQRFATDLDGVRQLVRLCLVYTGIREVAGFRSELRSGGLVGEVEAAEKTFQDLCAAWAGLEAEHGVEKLKTGFTKDSYAAWLKFRDRWKAGDPDTTALSAMAAEVNLTRQNLGKAPVPIQPPDVTESTASLRLANGAHSAGRTLSSIASEMAKDAAKAGGNAWQSIPVPAKVAGAAVAMLTAILTILRVTR